MNTGGVATASASGSRSQIVGAIGVSGVTSEQDAQVAKAGAEALSK
jgi:uncharacterized protein GlcG (DUF336 family)